MSQKRIQNRDKIILAAGRLALSKYGSDPFDDELLAAYEAMRAVDPTYVQMREAVRRIAEDNITAIEALEIAANALQETPK